MGRKSDYPRLEKYFGDRYPNIKSENLTKENLQNTLNEILRKERERYGVEKTKGIEGYVRKESALKINRAGWDWIESSVESWRKEKLEKINVTENITDIKEIEGEIIREPIESDFIHFKSDVISSITTKQENLMENVLRELGASEKAKTTLRPFLRDRDYDFTTIKTHLFETRGKTATGIWSPRDGKFITWWITSKEPITFEVREITNIPEGELPE